MDRSSSYYRERLMRETLMSCFHDWGHALEEASFAVESALAPATERRLDESLQDAGALLKGVRAEMRQVNRSLSSLRRYESDDKRFEDRFVLKNAFITSLQPFRSEYEEGGIEIEESYETDCEFVGSSPDLLAVLGDLFGFILQTLRPERQTVPGPKRLRIEVRSADIGTDLNGLTTGLPEDEDYATRLKMYVREGVVLVACLLNWTGSAFTFEAERKTPTRWTQMPPLYPFVFLAAHALTTGIGGYLSVRSDQGPGNTVTLLIPIR